MSAYADAFAARHPVINLMQLADETGAVLVDFLGLEPTVLVTAFDLGWPETREVTVNRAENDGTVDTTTLYGSRAVAMTLSMATGDDPAIDATVLGLMDTLRQLSTPDRRPYLYVRFGNDADVYRLQLRTDSWTAPYSWKLQPQLQWKAPDGALETVTEFAATVFAAGGVETGRVYPLIYPRNYGAGIPPGAIVISSGGMVPTWMIIRVYGPITNPTIANLTTGKRMVFTGLDVAAGDYVSIRTKDHTVLVNDDPNVSRLSYVDWTQSSWLQLIPGANQIALTADVVGTGSYMTLSWRDRRI